MEKMDKNGFLNALGALVYIALVGTLMQNGSKIFGETDNFITPIAVLLLFTLSAIVVGGLILGKPIMLYLDTKKKEAISLLISTALWLAGFTTITLLVALFLK